MKSNPATNQFLLDIKNVMEMQYQQENDQSGINTNIK